MITFKFSVAYQKPIWRGLIYREAYLLTISSYSFKLGLPVQGLAILQCIHTFH